MQIYYNLDVKGERLYIYRFKNECFGENNICKFDKVYIYSLILVHV